MNLKNQLVALLLLGLGWINSGVVLAQQSSDVTDAEADQLIADVQQICPISGNKLGDHGQPIKVKIGEEELFVCCQACLEDNPTIDPNHWQTIHDHFFQAQQICPVMEHEVPEDAEWTIVEGRIIYICCPPCTDKIQAEPQVYVAKLLSLYQESLDRRSSAQALSSRPSLSQASSSQTSLDRASND